MITKVIFIIIAVAALFLSGSNVISLHEKASIKGHVYRPSGYAVPEVNIKIYQNSRLGGEIKTDKDGYYEFDSLSPGTYKVVIMEYNVLDPERSINLRAGERLVLDYLLKFHPGYDTPSIRKVYGYIYNPSRLPISKAIVKLISPYNQSLVAKAITDVTGRYEITVKSVDLDQLILLAYRSDFTVATTTITLTEDRKIDFLLSPIK